VEEDVMKIFLTSLLTAVFTAASVSPALAATPDQEAAFLAAYRKAYEGGDTAALHAFLHTEGAPASIVGIYKMMQTPVPVGKLAKIELAEISPERQASLTEAREMPDGKKYKLPVKPYKLLVIEVSTGSSSKSTSKVAVSEIDGRLVIPVPVPAP
jgi:hypothetical protein